MWQGTIGSALVLIVSAILCLADAGGQDEWHSELIYKTKDHQDLINNTVDIIDVQATNIHIRELNFSIAQPWILEIYTKSPARTDEYTMHGWGVLIDRRAVLIGFSCDHRRLIENGTFVGVGKEKIKVIDLVRQSKFKNNKPDYMILILSTPILHINAIRLAVRGDRFQAGSICYTAGLHPNDNTKRLVVNGKNETEFIYTERINCSHHFGHSVDWFGMLVCPIEDGSSQVISSNYVLASVMRSSYHEDQRKCQIVYKKIGNSRRWIDNVLGEPNINTYVTAEGLPKNFTTNDYYGV